VTHPDRLVVKVGGSLYDHPRLKVGLKAWLAARPEAHILIVPGGGDFAEAVRRLDTVHGLGEGFAHLLALQSLETAALFVQDIVGVFEKYGDYELWNLEPLFVMPHPRQFLRRYQNQDCVQLPQTWEFTTDSLAACSAHDAGCELVLLKSVDIPPSMAWEDAAARGYVDAYFPTLVARHNLRVTAVNFRAVLDGSAAGAASGGRQSAVPPRPGED